MVNENIVCKIFFFDEDLKKTIKVIGVVNKKQLDSSLDNFIVLKNYGNKTISKKNLVTIFLYENQREVFVTKEALEINNRTKIEG